MSNRPVPDSVAAAKRRVREVADRAPRHGAAASRSPVYRRLWGRIHRRALAATPGFGVAAEQTWLSGLADELPCGACASHWRAHLASSPMVAATPADYFAWTVEAHNAVSARTSKATWSVAEARAYWSSPAGALAAGGASAA